MKKYFALSLLVVNVACAEQGGWSEWGAQKVRNASDQAQGLYTQAQDAVTDMIYGKEDVVSTAQETEEKTQTALEASYQTEQELRQAMKHERTAIEGKVYNAIADLMFLLEQCEQPGSECDEKQLAALKADMYRLLSAITSKTLAERALLTKRHEQEEAIRNANDVVQQGDREGAVIGVGDDEKKKILDEKYLIEVRSCHLLGKKCDKKYLSQLRDAKNAYEKAWMNQAVDNNNRMIIARRQINGAYSVLTDRADIDAFKKQFGITMPERENVQPQGPIEEQVDSSDDMSPVVHDLAKFTSEEQTEESVQAVLS